jgi:hypothetical protein
MMKWFQINATFFFLTAVSLHFHTTNMHANYQHDLHAGLLEFQFLRPKECLTDPFRNLSFSFGVKGTVPGLISRNNFVNPLAPEFTFKL